MTSECGGHAAAFRGELPGLIDAHTHMTFIWDRKPGTRPWSQLGTLHDAVTVFLAQENARKTLETGVTTV